jgi:hypothetical protein
VGPDPCCCRDESVPVARRQVAFEAAQAQFGQEIPIERRGGGRYGQAWQHDVSPRFLRRYAGVRSSPPSSGSTTKAITANATSDDAARNKNTASQL